MKGKKIIATLVVFAMLLSTLVVIVINQPKASAQPGVDLWGDATTDLEYGVSYAKNTIKINTSGWATGIYWLYYPYYECSTAGGRPATTFSWKGPYQTAGDDVYVNTSSSTGDLDVLNTYNQAITFNRSGMYIFDTDSTHSGSEPFIWVNTSTKYTISSINDFTYGSTNDVSIEIKEGDVLVSCRYAIIDPKGDTIINSATGADIVTIDSEEFTMAGEYTVRAYRDLDEDLTQYYYLDESGDAAYSALYGSNMGTLGAYNYSVVGPWDPPEKNATEKTFEVKVAKPTMVLKNTTMYWGYEYKIDVNITAPDKTGIDTGNTDNISLRAPDGKFYYAGDIASVTFNLIGEGNYSIEFPQWNTTTAADWHILTNGTWYVVFGYDINNDGNEEWNSSLGSMNKFVIKSTLPPVQMKIISDGDGDLDNEVNIPQFVNGSGLDPIEVIFGITGTSIMNEDGRLYYGDDAGEDAKNITVSGDVLWPVDVEDPAQLQYITAPNATVGYWHLKVIPVKPGGTFTITIDWPGDNNGTASQTIKIVDGCFVTTNVESFTVGANVTLIVTVKDMDQDTLKYANVYLIWETVTSGVFELSAFNSTLGDRTAGNGLNGAYSFLIDTSQQGNWAPRYLAVAVYDESSNLNGYHLVTMNKNHNMQVNVTPIISYAGNPTEYDITVRLVGGGSPKTSGLEVIVVNETGDEVIDPLIISGSLPTATATITDAQLILAGGTYYLYAFNSTHDSEGHNATITVTNYGVTASPSKLAWLIDTAVNITFQVTPAATGTLKLLNMTSTNGTWLEHETFVEINNGTGMIEEVEASVLGNVTFEFEPFGGDYRHANGLLRITTATATPSPATIYLGEATVVTITVTHPALGTPLEDVRVGLDHGMLLNESVLAKLPTDLFTDANGKVEFSLTADASGEIIIYIENETDADNQFVIQAAARKPMTIIVNPSTDEGKTFTVQAKSYDVLITTPVTFTFNGQAWPTTTGTATLTAPSVPTSMAYPITATAEGYVTATGTIIMVVNIPKLIIAIAGEVKAGQTFTATIADDTGGPVIGATVTFDGKTYTSGAGGVATITAPSKEGTYPVTATFPGYETLSDSVTVAKGGGIPGFELLTLIAAIGVAFLLLRRRRN